MENGTVVFVLQRATEASLSAVIERIKSTCASAGVTPKFESALLRDFTDHTAGELSTVIATLGPGFVGPISTKLH
jgi:hypothetical protein